MVENGKQSKVKMSTSKSPVNEEAEDVVVPKCIRDRSDMNWGKKYFLSEVIAIDQKTHGKFYCNLDELGKQFFVTKPTVHKWIKDLIQLGLIDLVGVVDEQEGFHRVIKPVLFRIFAQ